MTRKFNKIIGDRRSIKVETGLRYIRGNQKPYFTITAEIWERGRLESCGCQHSEVLKHFPILADIVRMHGADMDGVPTHAEANGWYWLAGALPDNAGERYHGASSDMQNWKDNGDFDGYRKATDGECIAIFAKHARLDTMESVRVWAQVEAAAMPKEGYERDWKAARAWFKQWIEEQRPRWKAEAAACIAAHDLKVFGDTYSPALEVA